MVKPRIGVQMMMLKEKVNEEGIYNVLKKYTILVITVLKYHKLKCQNIMFQKCNVQSMT